MGKETDPSEDSQDELLGVVTVVPTTETGGAALAAASSSSKGSKEERSDSGRPCQGLPTNSDHVTK